MGAYDGILVQKPIRSNDKVVTGSHYDDRRLKYGRSRDLGDASPEVQRQVIGALVDAGMKAGLNDHDIATVVAIVRYESGFNPDAANKSGSAAGLGQFTNVARKQYRVNTVFDITTNAEAVVHCYKESKATAIRHGHAGSQEELDRWTYGFYHDGPYGTGSKGSKIFSNPNGKPVSDETGISLPFILAHAAHEVDFGKKIEGNNLFNIKADEAWRGPTYTKGDKAYRAYPSYEESMKDYLEYLQSNPRYGKMFEPVTRQSLGRLVDAIHYAGYSDDPLYGPRILAAAKDPMMKQALWQFDKWPPKATGEG